MKVTIKKEEVFLRSGDIVKSTHTGSYFMITQDDSNYFCILSLKSFVLYSEKYISTETLLSHFFDKGYTIYPSDKNELVIGGI